MALNNNAARADNPATERIVSNTEMTVLVIAFVETAVRPPETAPQQPQTYRYEDMPRAGSFSSCGGCVTADVRLG